MKTAARLCVPIAFASLLAAAPALALGDGARACLLVPEKSTILAANAIFLDGNSSLDAATPVRNGNVAVDVVALQLTQSIRTGGNASGLFLIVPVGQARGVAHQRPPVAPTR